LAIDAPAQSGGHELRAGGAGGSDAFNADGNQYNHAVAEFGTALGIVVDIGEGTTKIQP
jgi:hypothetical protein